MTLRLPKLATVWLLSAFALSIAACRDIAAVKTVDLCQGATFSADCAQCRSTPPDPKCEQCQGDHPAAACKQAGDGGSGGAGAAGGKGGASGGSGGSGGMGGTGGTGGDAAADGGTGGDAGDAQVDAGPCGTCPAAKPACVDNQCQECGGDRDCTGAARAHCDTDTHSCVACLQPSDCGASKPECDTDTHSCVQCLTSAACQSGGKPQCDTDTHSCVRCLGNGDCDAASPQCSTGHVCGACDGDGACSDRSDTPRCDTATGSSTRGQCVQCLSSADCQSPSTPECTNRTCQACTSDTACTGRTGTEVCETTGTAPMHGQCVECTATKRTACASSANACKVSTGACTSTAYQSLLPCAPCETDGECQPGTKCVVQEFGSQMLGPYCFYEQSPNGCADTNLQARPYSNPVATTSIDGASSTYCLPPPTTTCAGIADATNWDGQGGGAKTCSMPDDCGENDISDGTCGANGKCTYSCNAGPDCPGTFPTCPSSGTKICQ